MSEFATPNFGTATKVQSPDSYGGVVRACHQASRSDTLQCGAVLRDELARFERQPWLANRPWCELLPPGSRVRKNDGVPSAPSCSLAPRGNLYLAHQQKFLPNAPSWTAHD